MRFTAPVTCLDVNVGHTHLAARSAEFTIKVVETADLAKTYTMHGHEAPLLWVKFDPQGGSIGQLIYIMTCKIAAPPKIASNFYRAI